jgi:hypothetical protein
MRFRLGILGALGGSLLWPLGALPLAAQDRTFGGYDCTDDCSGHAAGYRWAERRGVEDASECPYGNSNSFHEGCLAYAEDQYRGADEDDDGEEIDE